MFFSKIWFFLVSVGAVVALTIALVMPRPAERTARAEETRRVRDACSVTEILLTQNARVRISLAGDFAISGGLAKLLDTATRAGSIDGETNRKARNALKEVVKQIEVEPPTEEDGDAEKGKKGEEVEKPSIVPDFAILVDAKGRAVGRIGPGNWESDYGDSVKGYHLVEAALNGYQRDDIWAVDRRLFRTAASPVVYQGRYVGAVVLGHDIDRTFASGLAGQLRVSVSFYVADRWIATSNPVQIHTDVLAAAKPSLANKGARKADCAANEPFTVSAAGKSYNVLTARLPGEVAKLGGFYSVFIERPSAVGFNGTLGAVKSDDLSFGSFPWIPVGAAFLLMVGIGIGLMVFESDRPLKRLAKDALSLAQGDAERLAEDKHRGKFGSIARSVNIELDKMHREARAAKKELDQLLGPAPDTAAPTALPMSGPGGGGPSVPSAPPSAFKFSDSKSPPKPARAQTPAPFDLDLPPPPATMAPEPKKKKPAKPPAIPSGSDKPRPATDATVPPAGISLPDAPPPIPTPPKPPAAPPKPPTPQMSAIDDDILAASNAGLPTPEAEAKPATTTPKRASTPFDEEATRVADPSTALLEKSAIPDEESDDDVGNDQGAYFRKVYDEFIALKQKCGEPTSSLTLAKFSRKLEKNRAALIAKHGCKEVKFQVYIKDGKAALKATPVKR